MIGGCACFLNAFRYTRSEKRTTEVLQNYADNDPFPGTQEAARVALRKLGKSPPLPKRIVTNNNVPLTAVVNGHTIKISLNEELLPPPLATITDNLQAYYLVNIHCGQVLVVKGEVLNESSRPVTSVMVEGKLYKKDNTVVQTQNCYVRSALNSLTDKEIENLTVSEIGEKAKRPGLTDPDLSLLPVQPPTTQEKVPYRKTEIVPMILPAEKAPFVLVFHNLPENDPVNNYSVNVISAKIDEEFPTSTPPGNTSSKKPVTSSEFKYDFSTLPDKNPRNPRGESSAIQNSAPIIKTGYAPGYPLKATGGFSRLTIDNTQAGSDVLVKVVRNSTDAVRVFYIRNGHSFTVENMTPGTYVIRYRDLGSKQPYEMDSFSLVEQETIDGIRYSDTTITLYKVLDGNIETRRIPEDQF